MYVIDYMGDLIGPFISEKECEMFAEHFDLGAPVIKVVTAPSDYADEMYDTI